MTLCTLLTITEGGTECAIYSKDGKRIVEGRDRELINILHPELLELNIWAIELKTSFKGPTMYINIDKPMDDLCAEMLEWGD